MIFTATSELDVLYDVLNRAPESRPGPEQHTAGYLAGIAMARIFVLDECAYLSGTFEKSA